MLRLPASRSLLRTVAHTRVRHGHGTPHYNEPGGNLFGEPPLKAGEKRKWESWEAPSYIGWGAVLAVAVVGFYFRPDTRVNSWAYVEAERRLAERGELPTYKSSAKE